MAGPSAPEVLAGRLGWGAVSLASALVILGLAIVPFLTPAWIHFEQARSDSAAFTGYDAPTLDRVTDSIVHDLVLGGDFGVTAPPTGCSASSACAATPVLDDREVSHMRDVRGVFQGLAILVLASLAVIAAAWATARGRPTRRTAWWQAVGRGGRWLAAFMAVVGVLSIVAFDAAFEVFHELLFPAGSFSFDPLTEKLVQLFPDQFWSETSLALGVLALVGSIGVAIVASRRASLLARRTALAEAARSAGAGSGSAPAGIPGRSVP